MATPSEKHEIHCAKRYLEYTETPFYRAFRDRENPESFDSNYAAVSYTHLAMAEDFRAKIVNLPCSTNLTREDAQRVVDALLAL